MRVLLLAPQPFYQERGTPIAVDLLLRALSERGDTVDLVTFPEGEDVSHRGLTIHRCRPVPRVRGIKPGFSLGKVVCDVALFWTARRLMRAHDYDVVHAVEEAAFIARALCARRGTPFVYDMDSSMSDQLVDAKPWLWPMRRILRATERTSMRAAAAVVPMCEALAEVARHAGAHHVHVLKDVSLTGRVEEPAVESLKDTLGMEGPIVMYIGNLERYQGVDLLLDSFARVAEANPGVSLVIIGGTDRDIARYREETRRRGLEGRARLLGRRPVAAIGAYMKQADVLASPRIRGANTPMKLYSYLDSGVAVLATDLPTHTQVVTSDVAKLAAPEPDAFASAMNELLRDADARETLARRARALVRREHSYEAFRRNVDELYAYLERTSEASGAARAS